MPHTLCSNWVECGFWISAGGHRYQIQIYFAHIDLTHPEPRLKTCHKRLSSTYCSSGAAFPICELSRRVTLTCSYDSFFLFFCLSQTLILMGFPLAFLPSGTASLTETDASFLETHWLPGPVEAGIDLPVWEPVTVRLSGPGGLATLIHNTTRSGQRHSPLQTQWRTKLR